MSLRSSALVAATLAALAGSGAVASAGVSGSEDDGPPPPRSVWPKANKGYDTGTRFTFKVRTTGNDALFVRVSKSKKKAKDGRLKDPVYFRKMGRRKGSLFSKKVERYRGLRGHFINRPGTYYWQAHRIDCSEQDDCYVEGPVRKLRILED